MFETSTCGNQWVVAQAPLFLSPSFHFSCYTNVQTSNKYPYDHASFILPSDKTTHSNWFTYTHTYATSLSSVSAHTPLAVLCHGKHTHCGHCGYNSGAVGNAAESWAAATESHPSMVPPASSPPHIVAYTISHLFSQTQSFHTSQSAATGKFVFILITEERRAEGRGDNSLRFPRGKIQ